MGAAIKDIPIIDVDTHVIEPYDLWTSRLSSKWGDRAPQVRWDDNANEDAWFMGGEYSIARIAGRMSRRAGSRVKADALMPICGAICKVDANSWRDCTAGDSGAQVAVWSR